jgi:3-oxoacyl-[acyl-carrier protein] reductase
MNKKLLEGKNAIVTGCARGIGRKILEVFVINGANVWACAREQTEDFNKNAIYLSEKCGVKVVPVYFDLTDKEQMKIAVKQIISDKMKVDILVNNAGITYNALYQMSTIEQIHRTLEVNFIAPYLFTQYIVKLMLKNKSGSIINIASTAGLDGNSGRSVYGASKASVICATKALAEELGDKGIRANSIAPGITQTDMLDSMNEKVINETILKTDTKRRGKTDDIANAVLFLASDLSSYITGQVLRVDGGM